MVWYLSVAGITVIVCVVRSERFESTMMHIVHLDLFGPVAMEVGIELL